MKNLPFKFCVLGLCLLGMEIPALANDYYAPECCPPPCRFGRFNAGVEWLYWKVKEDNLRAGSFVDDHPDPVFKFVEASVIQPNFTFNSGVRANIGYECCCNPWDFEIIYTYVPLDSDSTFKEVIPIDEQTETHLQFIVPNLNGFPSFQAFGNSSGVVAFNSMFEKWGGNLSYIDVDLARRLTFSNCFELKPHVGFRAAWMTQNLLMKGDLRFPSTNDSTFGSLKFKEQYNGYGIEGGLWADWWIGRGFSFVGHAGGSILYSRFDLHILSEASIGAGGPVVFVIDTKSSDITAIPTIEYFAGINFETRVCRCAFSAHIGWEQRVLFNLNQLAVGSGNLSLQGLTLGIGIGY